MLVYREEGQSHEEDAFETLDVDLQKKSGRGLGLTIVGRKNGPGVFISEVVSMVWKHTAVFQKANDIYFLRGEKSAFFVVYAINKNTINIKLFCQNFVSINKDIKLDFFSKNAISSSEPDGFYLFSWC